MRFLVVFFLLQVVAAAIKQPIKQVVVTKKSKNPLQKFIQPDNVVVARCALVTASCMYGSNYITTKLLQVLVYAYLLIFTLLY